MRGYFGIGVEGVSKAANVGALMRTAHAFDAGFVFTVGADYSRAATAVADTSNAAAQVPFYAFPNVAGMMLPLGCKLVGVELLDDSVELPSFHHPATAAYVLGRERGSLTPEMLARCDHVVRIPTRFCVNLAVAGALVLYDRVLSRSRFAPRPTRPGGPVDEIEGHVHGGVRFRSPERMERFRSDPP
ncbi:MAG: RNA methyltransferase [Alphaproteobacteria bacterium]|nr:RNA methyltransferase [Alphaproteobacteria bacterium]